MSPEDPDMEGLEWRLRAMYAGLDARAGFEARVKERIAATGRSRGPASSVRYERRREAARRRLRRAAWTNAATLAGIAAGAAALAWRYAPAIERAMSADPLIIAAATLAALVIPSWPALRRMTPGFR